MKRYWLVKQEPESYPFTQLVADGVTEWDGVRNYQARNSLGEMSVGDRVLYYHSGKERAVVGLAEVEAESHPDSTTDDPRWLAVELRALKPLTEAVTLARIKEDAALADMALLRQSRLSVMPVTAKEFRRILTLGRTKP